jgi:hypothetical protein
MRIGSKSRCIAIVNMLNINTSILDIAVVNLLNINVEEISSSVVVNRMFNQD